MFIVFFNDYAFKIRHKLPRKINKAHFVQILSRFVY